MMEQIKTDVLIIGGGAAGFSAAVAVSEMGLKAIVIEKNSYLGGKATGAEVGTVCGLYNFSKNKESVFAVKGFAKKFAIELQSKSQTTPLSNIIGLHYLPYNIDVYKSIVNNYICKHNIHVYYNASLKKVGVDRDELKTATIELNENEIQFTFNSIIDCSGESIVSELAQLPIIEEDNYQAAAQVFTMENVEPISETQLGMVLIKELKLAIDNDILPPYFDRVYVVQGSVKNTCVSFKIGIPIEVTYKGKNYLDIKNKANEMIQELADFLIKHISVFKNAKLKSIAPEVGFRISKRPIGNYVLTVDDVLQCNKFEDAIAIGTWPIEKWGMDKRVQMTYFEYESFYQISLRCLKSKYIKNLFFAGRSISADAEAIASARVMGICFQTGYAAGVYASMVGDSEDLICKKIQFLQL